MHFNVYLLSLLIFMMVLMTSMSAQMKVLFPLLYAQWRIWTYKNAIACKQKMQNSLLNLSYVQMFSSWRWMHLRAIGRQFTQPFAYFLVMNSKRCNTKSAFAENYLFESSDNIIQKN